MNAALLSAVLFSLAAPFAAEAQKAKAVPLIGGSANLVVNPTGSNPIGGTGNSSQSTTFYVSNTGTASTSASIVLEECDGAVSGCSISPTFATIPKGGSVTVTVSYNTAISGTGTIMIGADWSGNVAEGSVTVVLPGAQPAVTVSPNPSYTSENFPTNDPNFVITNNGNSASTYNLSANCSGNISGCSVSTPSASVAPGGSIGAVVSYTTGPFQSGNGTATLTATSTLTGESSSTSVTVVPLSNAVSVTPDGGAASPGAGASTSAAFTVTNVGNSNPSTYSLGCSYTGVITSCSTPPSVAVSNGSPQTVNVGYTTNGSTAGGAGTLTLTASDNASGVHNYTDQGYYTVTVADTRTYTPVVTPKSDSVTYNETNVSTNFIFSVRNTGDTQAIYTLSAPTCTGTASGCSIPTNPVTVNSGQTVTVPVYFTTQGVGQTTTIDLHATMGAHGATFADDGSVQVVPLAPTVQVTPVQSSIAAQTNGSGTFNFNVHNTGNDGAITYTLQVTGCTAPLTGCSAPASVTVAQGADSIVGVSFQTQGTSGNGTVSLRAYKTFVNTYSSTATGTVGVTSRLQVSTAFMNNDDQDMGLCVGSCFAMTASRSTVPYYTLDTPRSITLVYNSDRAFPRPFVYADVAIPSAPAAVSSYTLEVKRLGVNLPFVNGETKLTFAGTSTPDTTYRLAGQIDMSSYGTMIDTVTLVATAHYANGESDVTPVKTQLMLVNYQSSEVARGWAIAGLQQLSYEPEGGSGASGFMARNGDGSATYFASSSAQAIDFSTLTLNGSVWTRAYPDGSKVLFDARGLMTAAIDRLGRQTTFQYGGSDGFHLVSITEPMRSSGSSTSAPYLSLSYDGNGRLSGITETGGTNGRTTSVTVDANGYLTRITDPDGGYDSYGYDGSGRLHTITDRRGNTTIYNYDAAWKLSQIVSPSVPIDNLAGGTTSGTPITNISSWQAVGVPFDTTASNPAPLTLIANVRATIVDPVHDTTAMYPNRWGESVKNIDVLGNVTTTQYQGFLPTIITHSDASVDSAAYDPGNGLLLRQRMAGQETVIYTHGNKNQVQSVYGNGMVTVTNTLDSLGRTIKTTYGTVAGDTTVFTYDSVTKNVASMFRPDTGLVTYQYEARFGNSSTETDPGNRVTQTDFDSYGRDTAVKAPMYPKEFTTYDVLNRVTAAYDSLHASPVTIKYDAILPVAVRDPLSNVDSTEYDALGNITRHFGYSSQTLATTIRYDLAGRPTSTTNRRGQRIDVTYDALGRVLSKSGDNTTADHFTYSANGLTQTAYNATDSIRTASVPTALVDTVQTTMSASGVAPHTYTIVHHQTNEASGTDSTTISSNGAPAQFVTRRYVNDGSSGTLSAINLGSSIGQTTFTYDAPGRRVRANYPTGAIRYEAYLRSGTHLAVGFNPGLSGRLNLEYRVDSAGRISADRRNLGGSATVDTNRIFGYDALGRYAGSQDESSVSWTCYGLGRTDPNYGEIDCPFDSLSAPQFYGYDASGNRTGTGITMGAGDQVTTSDGFSYTYDADGNVATRTETSTGTVWTYSWSSDNRLLGVSVNGTATVGFDYDALGNPVVKRTGTGQVRRVTLYDGASILADLDSLGNRQAEYVYDAGTDAPYAMLTGPTTASATRYYVQDDFGNVTGQFADSVNATEKVSYGDWGLPTISGETTNRITWKGLSYDSDVGLTYVRARWYDPNIGRFVSEDPLGLQGGVNPYVFANNDPIDGSDPSGMMIGFGDDGDNNETPHGGGGSSCVSKSLVNYNTETGEINFVIDTWDECTFAPISFGQQGTGGNGGTSNSGKPKSCSRIKPPPSPVNNPNASVRDNEAAIARALTKTTVAGKLTLFTNWVAMVRTGGSWDYKRNLKGAAQQSAANFGNFNYGATCAQFGLSMNSCESAAGIAGMAGGTRGQGVPFFSGAKGDLPVDNYYVKQGYQYATCKN